MRTTSGKGNDVRKILAYYRTNFNLTPPYRILCDGPTIHQSLQHDLYLKDSLPKLLGATAFPVVTTCILKELRSLGDDFSNAALFAKRATRIPCAHEEGKETSASECIVERLENQGDLHLILATNDADVIAKSSRIPGLPLISISKQKKLVLRPPSISTLEFVRANQDVKGLIINDQDRALLKQVEEEEMNKLPGKLRVKQIRKRKRAKGPNPLSVKKSKKPKLALPQDNKNKKKDSETMNLSDTTERRRNDGHRSELTRGERSLMNNPQAESEDNTSKRKKVRPRNREKKRSLPEDPSTPVTTLLSQASKSAGVTPSKTPAEQIAKHNEDSKARRKEKSSTEEIELHGKGGEGQMEKPSANIDEVNGGKFGTAPDYPMKFTERSNAERSDRNSMETEVEQLKSTKKDIRLDSGINNPISTRTEKGNEQLGKFGAKCVTSRGSPKPGNSDESSTEVDNQEGQKTSEGDVTKRKKQRKNRRRRQKKAIVVPAIQ